MDKPLNNSAASPGYETRDANVRGIFTFLVILGVVIVGTALVCWGLFRYFSKLQASSATSPFANTRQLPLGPQLQVDPREDLLKYGEQENQSLETYDWVNRGTGTVRVPIERAMELLVQKGLPVQNSGGPQAPSSNPSAVSAATTKPVAPAGKKP